MTYLGNMIYQFRNGIEINENDINDMLNEIIEYNESNRKENELPLDHALEYTKQEITEYKYIIHTMEEDILELKSEKEKIINALGKEKYENIINNKILID